MDVVKSSSEMKFHSDDTDSNSTATTTASTMFTGCLITNHPTSYKNTCANVVLENNDLLNSTISTGTTSNKTFPAKSIQPTDGLDEDEKTKNPPSPFLLSSPPELVDDSDSSLPSYQTPKKRKVTSPCKIRKKMCFEVPSNSKPGDKILLNWGSNGPKFAVTIPSVALQPSNMEKLSKPRIIIVAHPDHWSEFGPLCEEKQTVDEIHKEKTRRAKRSLRSNTICDKERQLYQKKESRVGKSFQATCLPEVGCYRMDRDDEIETSEEKRYEQIWNPDLAIKSGNLEDIKHFMDSIPPHSKDLGMISLHTANYCTKKARMVLGEIQECPGNSGDFRGPLTDAEKSAFNTSVIEKQKNFREISSKVGRSVNSCLAYYYGVFKQSGHYRKLKVVSELGECVVCEDGGDLICCDKCNDPYHLDCLTPKLTKVPENEWFCPTCEIRGERLKHKSRLCGAVADEKHIKLP